MGFCNFLNQTESSYKRGASIGSIKYEKEKSIPLKIFMDVCERRERDENEIWNSMIGKIDTLKNILDRSEFKRLYKKLIFFFHPDRNKKNTNEIAQRINKIFESRRIRG